MGQSMHGILCILMYVALSSIHHLTVQSLHLKLIHRDSIYSPVYPGNLTRSERLQRLYNYSQARAEFYETRLSQPGYGEEAVRPSVSPDGYYYLVELTVGTPPLGRDLKTYYLIMDTGSKLVWLQCQPCVQCWEQTTPIFDPSIDSGTFTLLPCDHPMCDLSTPGWECINDVCHYTVRYVPPVMSRGIVAADTFGFASDTGGMEFVSGLVFGCGFLNMDFNMSPKIAGLMGLSMGIPSLALQAGGRFAYCLQPLGETALTPPPPSRLRFGNEAILRGSMVKTIPFVQAPGAHHYYLNLVDISIGSHRIGYPPSTFARRIDGDFYRGGFVIDSGSPVTMLMTGITFELFRNAATQYFRSFQLENWNIQTYEICYKYPRNWVFRAYPSMTFHFSDNIDLVVAPQHVVYEDDIGFCMMIRQMSTLNLFGAYQQHNYRFSYDLINRQLSFVPANCLLDG